MKSSLFLLVAILIIWVTGIIILFFILNLKDGNELHGSRWSFLHSLHNTERYFRASTLQPQQLPQFSGHSHSKHESDDNRPKVYLQWLLHDSQFSVHNYVTLESLLATYPKALFTCLVVTNADLSQDKTEGLLAANKFLKYRKLGYDIKVKSIGERDVSPRDPTVASSLSSSRYLDTWLKPHCKQTFLNCSSAHDARPYPYHVAMYFALLSLYQTGGVYADFTFHFLSPLPSSTTQHIFYLNSYCLGKDKLYRPKSFDAWPSLTCYTSSLLYAPHRHSEVLRCILEKYHSPVFSVCLESDNYYQGALCLKQAIQACHSHGSNSEEREREESVIESFEDDPLRANTSLLSNNWTLLSTSRVLWLGHLAWQGGKGGGEGGSRHYPYHPLSLLSSATSRSLLIREKSSSPHRAKRTLPCLPFPSIPQREGGVASLSPMASLTCSPSLALLGFDSSDHAQLSALLSRHPLLLPPTCGPHYLGGGYEGERRERRADCFPYISLSEPFLSFESSPTLLLDPSALSLLKEENEGVKIVLLLRSPSLRLYAHYLHHPLLQHRLFDQEVLAVIGDRQHPLSQLRQMLTNHTPSVEVERFFTSTLAVQRRALSPSLSPPNATSIVESLLTQSLYSLFLLTLLNRFSVSNVKIYQFERIFLSKATARQFVRSLWSDLSLPKGRDEGAGGLVERREEAQEAQGRPEGERMTQEALCKLQGFLRPFNALLANLTQAVNTSLWEDAELFGEGGGPNRGLVESLPSRSSNNLLNASWPEMWFERELDDSPVRSKHLSSLLVPQRLSSEDSSFNTTLGMLNTF